MPLQGVAPAAKDYHAKKEAAESGGILYFQLGDGEEARVRFLEEGEDFTSYYVHRLPQQGNRYPQIPCLDPGARPSGRIPCPGCEDGHKRSYRFAVNLIWRDAPVYARDENNRIVKDANNKPKVQTDAQGNPVRKDQVFVWTGGIQVAEDLDHLDGKYGGLTSRDYEISRRGVKLNTTYTILPADAQPLTPADKELAKGKFDLNTLKKPPEYDQFYAYQGGGGGGGAQSAGGDAPSRSEAASHESPFRRRNRAG